MKAEETTKYMRSDYETDREKNRRETQRKGRTIEVDKGREFNKETEE